MERGDPATPHARAADASELSIFVCYRREDSAGFARALKTVLGARYGADRVFMDLDNIAPGERWEDVVNSAVSSCDVLIALIGKRWMTIRDGSGQHRIDDPLDPVRLEIEAGLRERLKIVPTLLQGAKMPQSGKLPVGLRDLPGIQALAITDDWDAGVSKLVATLDGLIDQKKQATGGAPVDRDQVPGPAVERSAAAIEPGLADAGPSNQRPARSNRVARSIVAALVALGLVAGGVIWVLTRPTSPCCPSPSPAQAGGPAVHDYLWRVHRLVQESASQLSEVQAAITQRDPDALRSLQDNRNDLLKTVAGWEVPSEGTDVNKALEDALQYSAASDGNWANYAEGNMSADDARAYDDQTVHPAKDLFVRLYNQLLAGVDDAPPSVASSRF